MIRITLTLTGALAALAFSAATAHADPDAPTPIAGTDSPITQSDAPWFEQLQYSQDFSVLNAPDETFEGVVRLDTNGLGLDDHNVSVVQDISGNVPVGGSTTSSLSTTAGAWSTTAPAVRRRLSTSRRSVTSTFLPGLSRR